MIRRPAWRFWVSASRVISIRALLLVFCWIILLKLVYIFFLSPKTSPRIPHWISHTLNSTMIRWSTCSGYKMLLQLTRCFFLKIIFIRSLSKSAAIFATKKINKSCIVPVAKFGYSQFNILRSVWRSGPR